MSSHIHSGDNTSGRKKAQVPQQHVAPYRGNGSSSKPVYVTGKDVTDAVTPIKTALVSLDKASEASKKKISSLDTKVGAINGNISASLDAHKKEIASNLAALANKIDATHKDGDAKVGTSLSSHKKEVDAKVSSLGASLDAHKKEVDAIHKDSDAKVSTLAHKVDSSLSAHKKEVGSSLATLGHKVDSALATHKKDSDAKVSALGAKVDSSLNAHKKEDEAKIASLHGQVQGLTHELKATKKQLHSLVARLSALESKDHLKKLHIGDDADIPDQPDSKKESGVWKDAPLSLSINGGLVLHDVGYTNKKGYNITLDPDTHRLLVYHGK